MDCKYAENDDFIVDYVEGNLADDAREAFEAHYFGCDRCFTQLQMNEKLIGVMQERGDKVFARFKATIPKPGPVYTLDHLENHAVNWIGRLELFLHRRRHLAGLAALAIVVLAIGGWFTRYFLFPADYEKLAKVEPLPWPAVKPLGGEADKLIEQARQQFNEMEYDGASSRLAEALSLKPAAADLEYLLGVSYFLANDTDAAINRLSHALTLNPDLENAHWYLANAYLKNEDHHQAIEHLSYLVEIKSPDYAERAREILKAIDPFYFLGRGF